MWKRLATILCDFLNVCSREQTYPDKFKCSRITPLYKKSARTCIENHRSVASMCHLSKIFDSLIRERLTDYFMDSGLLSGNPFCFRQDRNTELAVFHKILPAFEVGSYCICVFFLYILVLVLIQFPAIFFVANYIGMKLGALNSFLKCYFQNRTQFVAYSTVESLVRQQNIGTIRFSKLAPRLFDIYSNDMDAIFMNNENVLYADDTAIACVGDYLIALERSVNSIIARLLDWCRFNKMFLNPSKCEFMLSTNKHVHI